MNALAFRFGDEFFGLRNTLFRDNGVVTQDLDGCFKVLSILVAIPLTFVISDYQTAAIDKLFIPAHRIKIAYTPVFLNIEPFRQIDAIFPWASCS